MWVKKNDRIKKLSARTVIRDSRRPRNILQSLRKANFLKVLSFEKFKKLGKIIKAIERNSCRDGFSCKISGYYEIFFQAYILFLEPVFGALRGPRREPTNIEYEIDRDKYRGYAV